MLKKALYPYDAWKSVIVWSKPISYDDFVNGVEQFDDSEDTYETACSLNVESTYITKPLSDKGPNFYMILGKWSDKLKCFYLGKTTNSIYKRVTARDHKDRKEQMHNDYSKHKLLISKGHFYMGDWANKTKKRIDEIESLLIYANEPFYNDKKRLTNRVNRDYWIKNCGHYEPLYEELYYGLSVKE
nr:hypothetical protein [uncultured Methanolobus sp.]